MKVIWHLGSGYMLCSLLLQLEFGFNLCSFGIWVCCAYVGILCWNVNLDWKRIIEFILTKVSSSARKLPLLWKNLGRKFLKCKISKSNVACLSFKVNKYVKKITWYLWLSLGAFQQKGRWYYIFTTSFLYAFFIQLPSEECDEWFFIFQLNFFF